jgi:SAM-dependent methyltransferase/outer membrane murein-binding lipoprotein Lpp
MDRKTYIMARIDLSTQYGLEIGALDRPVIPHEAGHIEYVDHLPTDLLREKYATDPNVDISKIVPVSYIWGATTLPEAVGDKRFDYVIASHVIEHVPDPIGWLREIADVLKPGGFLFLAIPDKRWTFDCRREITPVSALLESYFEGYRRPTIRHFVDCFGEFAAVPDKVTISDLWQGKVSFFQIPLANPDYFESLGEAGLRARFEDFKNGTYIDAHCNVFTPFSFVSILAVLARLSLLNYRVADFQETPVNDIEFFVTLEKMPDSPNTVERTETILGSLPSILAPLHNGEVNALGSEVNALRSEVNALRSEGNALRSEGNALRSEVNALRSAIIDATMQHEMQHEMQRERIATLKIEIDTLLSSTSWRTTAPLRAVKRWIISKQ